MLDVRPDDSQLNRIAFDQFLFFDVTPDHHLNRMNANQQLNNLGNALATGENHPDVRGRATRVEGNHEDLPLTLQADEPFLKSALHHIRKGTLHKIDIGKLSTEYEKFPSNIVLRLLVALRFGHADFVQPVAPAAPVALADQEVDDDVKAEFNDFAVKFMQGLDEIQYEYKKEHGGLIDDDTLISGFVKLLKKAKSEAGADYAQRYTAYFADVERVIEDLDAILEATASRKATSSANTAANEAKAAAATAAAKAGASARDRSRDPARDFYNAPNPYAGFPPAPNSNPFLNAPPPAAPNATIDKRLLYAGKEKTNSGNPVAGVTAYSTFCTNANQGQKNCGAWLAMPDPRPATCGRPGCRMVHALPESREKAVLMTKAFAVCASYDPSRDYK